MRGLPVIAQAIAREWREIAGNTTELKIVTEERK
jgi:hypothetical protein